jgi:hypothetical protein
VNDVNDLSREEIGTLGRYNAERHRGITHTAEWQERMAALQERFDRARASSEGQTP